MFCVTVSDGMRLKAWKTKPIRSRRRIVRRRSLSLASSASPISAAPEVGRSSPAATCRKVLLPEPDGPMIAVNDPRAKPMLTPSSATTVLSPFPLTLRTSRRATAGSAGSVVGAAGVAMPLTLIHNPFCVADSNTGRASQPARAEDRLLAGVLRFGRAHEGGGVTELRRVVSPMDRAGRVGEDREHGENRPD